ncbi:hypothetical protein SUDANB15_04175 [Streptomyces sp. enrichment culture]
MTRHVDVAVVGGGQGDAGDGAPGSEPYRAGEKGVRPS